MEETSLKLIFSDPFEQILLHGKDGRRFNVGCIQLSLRLYYLSILATSVICVAGRSFVGDR